MLNHDKRPPAGARQSMKDFVAINKKLVNKKSNTSLKQRDEERSKQQEKSYRRNVPAQAKSRLSPIDNSGTLIVNRNDLQELIKGTIASMTSTQLQSLVPTLATQQPQDTLVEHSSSKHVTLDHNQIPGLTKLHYSSEPPLDSSPQSTITHNVTYTPYKSPQGPQTYHRGTTNRPVHPAMRSQLFEILPLPTVDQTPSHQINHVNSRDHNVIPGLTDASFPINSSFHISDPSEVKFFPTAYNVPRSSYESPQGPQTYHHGTTNRPVHQSQISKPLTVDQNSSHQINHTATNRSVLPGLTNTSTVHYSQSPLDPSFHVSEDKFSLTTQDVPKLSYESPRGSQTYHRGTTNRPVHPAMRSQIPLGDPGPDWSTHDDIARAREQAKHEWMSELATQMKANNRHNPSSVAGRSGASHVSVGLQDQQSPREMTEKIQKQMEHKEYLLFQMKEKQRKKEEERMRIENEAKDEELRLQREREKLAREFEMEKQMQKRKKIEEQKKIELLQSRIKMAEESAIAAKEEMKKSKRLVHQQSGKHVSINDERMDIGEHHKHNTDNRHYDGIKTSLDLRSPSLHTIPITVSHSEKSFASPRIVKNSAEKSRTRLHKNNQKHAVHVPGSNNSQVSLYSSSSEEPAVPMKRRARYKHEEPSAFKTSGPPVIEGSRIPRRIVSRKQIAKPTQSESESDVNFNGKRKITSTQSQQPNSIAKPKTKSAAYRVRHRTYRPASNESLDELVHRPRRPLTKAHSVPESKEDILSLPPVTRKTSPPVPAVAHRLGTTYKNQKENNTLPERDTLPPIASPPVPAVAHRLDQHIHRKKEHMNTLPEKDTLPPIIDAPSPPVPALARQLAHHVPGIVEERKTLPERGTLPPVVDTPSPPGVHALARKVHVHSPPKVIVERNILPPIENRHCTPPTIIALESTPLKSKLEVIQESTDVSDADRVDQPFPDAVPARYSYLKVIGRRLSDGKIAIKDQICVLPTIAEESINKEENEKAYENKRLLIEQLHRLRKQIQNEMEFSGSKMHTLINIPRKFHK